MSKAARIAIVASVGVAFLLVGVVSLILAARSQNEHSRPDVSGQKKPVRSSSEITDAYRDNLVRADFEFAGREIYVLSDSLVHTLRPHGNSYSIYRSEPPGGIDIRFILSSQAAKMMSRFSGSEYIILRGRCDGKNGGVIHISNCDIVEAYKFVDKKKVNIPVH